MQLRIVLAGALAAATAGCGNDRTPQPDLAVPLAPRGEQVVRYPDAGVRFRAPGAWRVLAGQGRLVATVSSGTATIAVWRYPRTEPLPADRAALRAARRALVAKARERDRSLRGVRTRVLRIGGEPAIELRASGRVGEVRRRIRSTHVFAEGAEVVVDAYAAPRHFARVDRTVFRPLARSLRVSAAPGR